MNSIKSTHRVVRFLLVLLLLATAAPATATSPATSPAAAAARDSAALELLAEYAGEQLAAAIEDLTWQAEQEGITLADAIDKYGWQVPFAELVHEIRLAHPESFAGARILSEKRTSWIAFKEEAPTDALGVIAKFPRRVDVIESRGFSEADLDAQLREIHFAVMAQKDIVETASSSYDIDTGVITVEFAPRIQVASETTTSALVQLVRERTQADAPNVRFRIVNEILSSNDANLLGGAHMSQCTSGFTVFKGSSRNLSTAGHCDNNLTYTPENVSLTTQDEHEGQWGDVQRMSATGNHTFTDDFYHMDQINTRDVVARGVEGLGQLLYRYGKTTGRESDTVYKRNQCSGARCGLTAMHRREAADGDSGGPWYVWRTAYGIHQGGIWIWFRPRDVFTPQHHIDDALPGWLVATS